MGATIVGTSSSQAPNTYMETTPFVLPNTKLNGSISNSLQLYLPIDDPRAKQLRPDLTGSLMKVDIGGPAYLVILDMYRQYLKEEDLEK